MYPIHATSNPGFHGSALDELMVVTYNSQASCGLILFQNQTHLLIYPTIRISHQHSLPHFGVLTSAEDSIVCRKDGDASLLGVLVFDPLE